MPRKRKPKLKPRRQRQIEVILAEKAEIINSLMSAYREALSRWFDSVFPYVGENASAQRHRKKPGPVAGQGEGAKLADLAYQILDGDPLLKGRALAIRLNHAKEEARLKIKVFEVPTDPRTEVTFSAKQAIRTAKERLRNREEGVS